MNLIEVLTQFLGHAPTDEEMKKYLVIEKKYSEKIETERSNYINNKYTGSALADMVTVTMDCQDHILDIQIEDGLDKQLMIEGMKAAMENAIIAVSEAYKNYNFKYNLISAQMASELIESFNISKEIEEENGGRLRTLN